MPELRFPTLEEFWRRLELRRAEPDLQRALRERMLREQVGTPRLGEKRGAVAVAVAGRLLPSVIVPAEALACFLDWSFDRPLGRGDERSGVLPTPELIPAGLDALDHAAVERHGQGFATLADEAQDELLSQAEEGNITLAASDDFDSSVWFKRTRGKLILGYGSDPRGMVEMGFPGPSYRDGHIWLDRGEVRARARRTPGYLRL